MSDDRAVLDWYLADRTRQGWKIVSRSETSAQLEKPKQWSGVGLTLFVVLPAIAGVLFWLPLLWGALIGLLLVIMDFVTKKQDMTFVTLEDAKKAQAAYYAKHP